MVCVTHIAYILLLQKKTSKNKNIDKSQFLSLQNTSQILPPPQRHICVYVFKANSRIFYIQIFRKYAVLFMMYTLICHMPLPLKEMDAG